MSDPIADMLTRIRNANTAKHDTVDIPASKMKVAIAGILVDEGYIEKYDIVEDGAFKTIRVTMKYGSDKNEKIITGIKRIPEFNPAVAKSIDDMFNNKYTLTLHIYNDKLYWVDRAAKVSKVFDLEDSNWSTTIKNIIGEMEDNAKDD